MRALIQASGEGLPYRVDPLLAAAGAGSFKSLWMIDIGRGPGTLPVFFGRRMLHAVRARMTEAPPSRGRESGE